MTQASTMSQDTNRDEPRRRSVGSLLAATEFDVRLLGMIVALAVIWIGFNILSGGSFLTPRNLWNLSVQSSAIAIMATGMVLIIVSRNIDLSIGSILGLTGYTMAMVQAVWIPSTLGLGLDQPYTWIIALIVGIAVGALVGGIQGVIVGYGGVPSFIVTLGGLLIWRGLIFQLQSGQTIAPLDRTFFTLGGGLPTGSIGELASWIVGLVACVAIVVSLVNSRRRRQRYGFPVRVMWAEVTLGSRAVSPPWRRCGSPTTTSCRRPSPTRTQRPTTSRFLRVASTSPIGIAYPVFIMIGVAIVMWYVATPTALWPLCVRLWRQSRGGRARPASYQADRRRDVRDHGHPGRVSAAIQTARLNSAVTSLGFQNELDTIAAAVIGGTSFSGGVGTIPGAILGAVVMQSLRSGMLLLNVDSPQAGHRRGHGPGRGRRARSFLRRRAST